MAIIIDFPQGELTKEERKRFKEFMEKELADIQDTSCNTSDKLDD